MARSSMGDVAATAPVKESPNHGPTAVHCQAAGVPGPEMGCSAVGWPHPRTTLAVALNAGL